MAIARRGGDNWYVGAITNGEARDLEIDCSFLEKGKTYTLTAIEDGANAHRRAIDYRQTTSTCTAGDRFTVHLAPGGGWVGRFSEVL